MNNNTLIAIEELRVKIINERTAAGSLKSARQEFDARQAEWSTSQTLLYEAQGRFNAALRAEVLS